MAELPLHGLEGGRELSVDLRRELLDERLEVVDGLLEVAPLFAQEGGALRKLRALRLGERVDRPDALAAARESLDALAERRLFGLVGRRREPGLVELLAHLVEAGGELRPAILEARERHLDRRAPLAGLLEAAAQQRLLVRQAAQLPALQARALLVTDIQLRDEARGVRPQGAGARLHGRARGADLRDLHEPPLELFQALAIGGGTAAGRLATLGGTRGGGAALFQLDAAARHQRQRLRVDRLGPVEGRLGVGGSRTQLLHPQQGAVGCGVGRLLGRGGLGQLGGHALHDALVALQVLLEVAPAGPDLRQAPLRGLGGDARLALRRGRGGRRLASGCLPSGGQRDRRLLSELARRDGVQLLAQPLEQRAPFEEQCRRDPARETDLPVCGAVVRAFSRHRQSRELGRHGAQVVDDHHVRQSVFQSLVLAEAHLVGERRGARERDRRPAPRRDHEPDQPDPGAPERIQQGPVVDATGHRERARELGQRRGEGTLVPRLARDAAGERDGAGELARHLQHLAADVLHVEQGGAQVIGLGLQRAPLHECGAAAVLGGGERARRLRRRPRRPQTPRSPRRGAPPWPRPPP